jgi:hypothetical protein
MSTRTVRLDDETEKILQQIVQTSGLSVSSVLKRGILLLQDTVTYEAKTVPYDIYQELDLGPGGYAIAPSTDTQRAVKESIKGKLPEF